MYYCEICDYQTDDKSNFNRHEKNKNHLKKITNIDEVNKLRQKIKEMEMDFKYKNEKTETEYKHKIEIINKEKEKLEEVNKILKEQANKITNNTQNNIINIGSINYVNEHFKDAPPLERLTNFIIHGVNITDASQHDKFIRDVIYYHNNKILHQLLGDHIITLYKKKGFKSTIISYNRYI
jgi:hypothetical protein